MFPTMDCKGKGMDMHGHQTYEVGYLGLEVFHCEELEVSKRMHGLVTPHVARDVSMFQRCHLHKEER
jgi:hypothetical protein